MSIPLAILWHQHQPYYKDLVTGELTMPWVRLHGVKDYYGMARLIQEFPGMRCTINLVPSLVAQLLDYVEHGATDPFLRRTELPADGLAAEDVHFILDHFFMAQWERMVRIYPRFGELLELRRFGRRPAARAASDFGVRDLRDLQVWFNLAWFHPVSFEETPSLRALLEKGRDFSEAEKAEVLRVQREVLARVIPLHRELSRNGQVELTTTPFYHPILPLLCDMGSARVAMPRVPMPVGHHALIEDAEAQVSKALAFHEQVFGARPVGMWPAEGSVSPAIVPLLARHGIRWMATDEEILGASLGTGLRGAFGKLERAELLYRPWKVQADGAELDLLFRDHELSDLVGFQYQGWDGAAAAEDFLGRVERAGRTVPAGAQPLVSVILDGENCWEHYPQQGVKFLRALYGRLQDGRAGVSPVRVGEALARHPPTQYLGKLFSGSWINHDFYIWIGHAEDRKAWEYVFRVREDLLRETLRRGAQAPFAAGASAAFQDPGLTQAWEELYIAEGSDWYWWYGDDRSSGNDEAFDRLFRTHLKNVYLFLGLPTPFFLENPVMALSVAGRYTRPGASLRITLDGRATNYFEWLGAGRYRSDREGGVMAAASPPLVHQIYFGYGREHLCVRVDLAEEPGKAGPEAKPGPQARGIALLFVEPKGVVLRVDAGPPLTLRQEGPWPRGLEGVEVVWDEILELRVPFKTLNLTHGQELSFYVEASGSGGTLERFPRSSALQFALPPENSESHEWMV